MLEEIHDGTASLTPGSIDRNHRRYQSNLVNLFRPLFFYLAYVIAAIVRFTDIIILTLTAGHTCDQPLRVWLYIDIAIEIVNFIVHFVRYRRQDDKAYATLGGIVQLFNFGWFIFGFVLIVDPGNCISETPVMYYLVLFHLCFGFIFSIFMACLAFASICCLFFVAHMMILYLIRYADYLPITIGATEEEMSSLPIYTYQNAAIVGENFYANVSDEDAACSICLAEYSQNDRVRMLQCGHHYHEECCDKWLKVNKSCAICRSDDLFVTV